MPSKSLNTSSCESRVTPNRRSRHWLIAMVAFVPAVAPDMAFANKPAVGATLEVSAIKASARTDAGPSAMPATSADRPVKRPPLLEGRLHCLVCDRPWLLGAPLMGMFDQMWRWPFPQVESQPIDLTPSRLPVEIFTPPSNLVPLEPVIAPSEDGGLGCLWKHGFCEQPNIFRIRLLSW